MVTSAGNQSVSSPPQLAVHFGFSLAYLEMLIHPLVMCVSALSFSLVLATRVLHPNLRVILLTQSVILQLFELERITLVATKLYAGNPFYSGPVFLQNASMFLSFFRDSLGHVLLLERILATHWVATYEHTPRRWFSAAWPSILLLLCCLNVWTVFGQNWGVSMLNMVTQGIVLALNIVQSVVFSRVGKYNQRQYTRTSNLSEKYQLSENIRTNRQLRPTFVLHLLNQLALLLSTSPLYFSVSQYKWLLSLEIAFTFCVYALLNFLIELTVITHHPILLARAQKWIRKGKRAIGMLQNRVQDSSEERRVGEEPRRLDGQKLIVEGPQKGEQYFRMLNEHWNEHRQ